MRRSGNREENKRIIMDLDVVIKSHDCPYIVQCVGTFITKVGKSTSFFFKTKVSCYWKMDDLTQSWDHLEIIESMCHCVKFIIIIKKLFIRCLLNRYYVHSFSNIYHSESIQAYLDKTEWRHITSSIFSTKNVFKWDLKTEKGLSEE